MRDKIIAVLKSSDKALDIYEIQDNLSISSVGETEELVSELKKLEDEVIIYDA